jgi:hypothetical protein
LISALAAVEAKGGGAANHIADAPAGADADSDADDIENQAAYVAGRRKKLRDDRKLLIHAATQAQRAADYILADCTPHEFARRPSHAWAPAENWFDDTLTRSLCLTGNDGRAPFTSPSIDDNFVR